MCNILDGKSYELFQLLVQFYHELTTEADRVGIRLEMSQIDKVIREGRHLVYAPAHPTKLTQKKSDEDLTEPTILAAKKRPPQ